MLKVKRFIYFFSVIFVFMIFFVYAIHMLSSGKKELNLLRVQRNEMALLKDEFLSLKQRIDVVQGKTNLMNVQGIIQAVDEVFLPLGMKEKVKTVKTTGKRELKEGFEEEADIYIEKVSMNQMVNIFYRINNAPMVLTIKKVTIKKSFENPELLNITLDLSFFRAK